MTSDGETATRSEPVAIDRRRWAFASALFIPTWFVVLASLPSVGGALWRARFFFRPDRHDAAPELLAASFVVYLPLAIAYTVVVRRRFERGDVAKPSLVAGLLTVPFAAVFLAVLAIANVWVDDGFPADREAARDVFIALGVAWTMGVPYFAILGVPVGALSAWVMAHFARRGDG